MNWSYLYFSPRGRINRQPYWLASIPLIVLQIVVELWNDSSAGVASAMFMLVVLIFAAVCGIMLGIKRCHDRDRSGWFLLISLIPIVGAIWLLIDLGFLRGTAGPNRFGPDPLAASYASVAA